VISLKVLGDLKEVEAVLISRRLVPLSFRDSADDYLAMIVELDESDENLAKVSTWWDDRDLNNPVPGDLVLYATGANLGVVAFNWESSCLN